MSKYLDRFNKELDEMISHPEGVTAERGGRDRPAEAAADTGGGGNALDTFVAGLDDMQGTQPDTPEAQPAETKADSGSGNALDTFVDELDNIRAPEPETDEGGAAGTKRQERPGEDYYGPDEEIPSPTGVFVKEFGKLVGANILEGLTGPIDIEGIEASPEFEAANAKQRKPVEDTPENRQSYLDKIEDVQKKQELQQKINADEEFWNLSDEKMEKRYGQYLKDVGLEAQASQLFDHGLVDLTDTPDADNITDIIKERHGAKDVSDMPKEDWIPDPLGVTDVQDAAPAFDVLWKLSLGEDVDADMLKTLANMEQEELQRMKGKTYGRHLAEGTIGSFELMGGIAVTGGMGGVTKIAAKGGQKAAAKGAKKAVLKKVKDVAGRGVKGTGKAALRELKRLPWFQGKTISKAAAESVRNVELTEDEKGELAAKIDDDKFGNEIIKQNIEYYIELLSEQSGRALHIPAGKAASKIWEKLSPHAKKLMKGAAVRKMARMFPDKKTFKKGVDAFSRNTGVQGLPEEWGEERLGDFARWMVTGVGELADAEGLDLGAGSPLPTMEQQAVEIPVLFIAQAPRVGAGWTAKGAQKLQDKIVDRRKQKTVDKEIKPRLLGQRLQMPEGDAAKVVDMDTDGPVLRRFEDKEETRIASEEHVTWNELVKMQEQVAGQQEQPAGETAEGAEESYNELVQQTIAEKGQGGQKKEETGRKKEQETSKKKDTGREKEQEASKEKEKYATKQDRIKQKNLEENVQKIKQRKSSLRDEDGSVPKEKRQEFENIQKELDEAESKATRADNTGRTLPIKKFPEGADRGTTPPKVQTGEDARKAEQEIERIIQQSESPEQAEKAMLKAGYTFDVDHQQWVHKYLEDRFDDAMPEVGNNKQSFPAWRRGKYDADMDRASEGEPAQARPGQQQQQPGQPQRPKEFTDEERKLVDSAMGQEIRKPDGTRVKVNDEVPGQGVEVIDENSQIEFIDTNTLRQWQKNATKKNPYMKMSIERVKRDADQGNKNAQEALSQRQEEMEESLRQSENAASFRAKSPKAGSRHKKAKGHWAVMKLKDLAGDKLQPRDRERSATMARAEKIYREFDAEEFGDSITSDRGAPIVNSKGQRLAGDLRRMVLEKVYADPDSWQYKEYQHWLQEYGREKGLSEEVQRAQERNEAPVMVRVADEFENTDEKEFADDSNSPVVQGYSEAERAWDDAELIRRENLIPKLNVPKNGDLTAPGNSEFWTDFLDKADVAAEMTKEDGSPNETLRKRMERAVLASLLTGSNEQRETVTYLLENNEDATVKRVVTGTVAAAPEVLKLQNRGSKFDVVPTLGRAVTELINARQAVNRGEFTSVKTYFDQPGLFSDAPEGTRQLVEFMDEQVTSQEDMRNALEKYVNNVSSIDENTPGLFSNEEVPEETIIDLLTGALDYAQWEQEVRKAQEQNKRTGGKTGGKKRGPGGGDAGGQPGSSGKSGGKAETEEQNRGEEEEPDVEGGEQTAYDAYGTQIREGDIVKTVKPGEPGARQTPNTGDMRARIEKIRDNGETLDVTRWDPALGSMEEYGQRVAGLPTGDVAALPQEDAESEQAESEESQQEEQLTERQQNLKRAILELMSAQATPVEGESNRARKTRYKRIIRDNLGDDLTATQVEDVYEASLVEQAIRDVQRYSKDPRQAWIALSNLHNDQLTLSARTSTSVRLQQFSTPAPLAFAANYMANVEPGGNETVADFMAGTGMLLMMRGSGRGNARAVEIDPFRAELLEAMGFENVTAADAREHLPNVPDKSIPHVVVNPPFEALKEEVRFGPEGHRIQKLDHLLALMSLEKMTDNGTATLIVGAERDAGTMSRGMRTFLNYIYSRYNVAGHFDVAGELYQKQGAAWPIKMITVKGRLQGGDVNKRFAPSPEDLQRFNSYDNVYLEARRIADEEGHSQKHLGTEDQGQQTGGDESVPGGDDAGDSLDGGTESGGGVGTQSDSGGTSSGNAQGGGQTAQGGSVSGSGGRGGASGIRNADRSGQSGGAPDAAPEQSEGDGPVGGGGLQQTGGGQPGPSGEGGGAVQPDRSGGTPAGGNELDQANLDAIDDVLNQEAETEGGTEQQTPQPEPEPGPTQQPGTQGRQGTSQGTQQTGTGQQQEQSGQSSQQQSGQGRQEQQGEQQGDQSVPDDVQSSIDNIRKSLGRMNAGIDPTLARDFARVGVHYLRQGVGSFRIWSERIVQTIGESMRSKLMPYLHYTWRQMKRKWDYRKHMRPGPGQIAYLPQSQLQDLNTYSPDNLDTHMRTALTDLENRVGNIDEFVRGQLRYATLDEMRNALAAEQVDAVALAIDQATGGKGLIVGDQTGVGKGRVAAAMVRWAQGQNRTPVFMTEKANLFSDMYRDLQDVGTLQGFNPFIFNADASVVDENGTVKARGQKVREVRKLLSNPDMADDYSMIMATYSQVNRGPSTDKAQALQEVARGGVLILDESHTASGNSNTFYAISSILPETYGAVYLSATYAKRSDNMPVYMKTDLTDSVEEQGDEDRSLFDRMDQQRARLTNAVSTGGTPLLQWASESLTEQGQYLRREQDWSGADFDVSEISEDSAEGQKIRESLDASTDVLSRIVEWDRKKQRYLEQLNKDLAKIAEGKKPKNPIPQWVLDIIQTPGGDITSSANAAASVQTANFASVVHNSIRQALLGVKADIIVDQAAEALENGEQVVIGLDNTMGSFIKEAMDRQRLSSGDYFSGRFDHVLEQMLQNTLRAKVIKPNGDEAFVHIPHQALEPAAAQEFENLQQMIEQRSIDVPASPIDYIRSAVEQRNPEWTTGELTGRGVGLDYNNLDENGNPALYERSSKEINDRNSVMRKFNRGETRLLVINQAGSTGVSLHSSENFDNRQPRRMIVAQPSLNIQVFVQMLGRIFRTGQVNQPIYRLLKAPVPSEKRPFVVLEKKLRSLFANTTAETGSPVSGSAMDMFNRYGDRVFQEYMGRHPSLMQKLFGPNKSPDDVDAAQITGKMSLLPVQEQEEVFDEVESEYEALINYLNETGQNDLNREERNWQVRTLNSQTLIPGEDNSNPFRSDVVMEQVEYTESVPPPTWDEVQEEVGRNADAHDELSETIRQRWEEMETEVKARYDAAVDAGKMSSDVARSHFRGIGERVGDVRNSLQNYAPGTQWKVTLNGEDLFAVVTNVTEQGEVPSNVVRRSDIKVRFALASGQKHMTVPLSQLEKGAMDHKRWNADEAVKKAFSGSVQRTVQRTMLTGNMIRAVAHATDVANIQTGAVVQFSRDTGEWETGLMVPSNAVNAVSQVRLESPEAVSEYLGETEIGKTVKTNNGLKINQIEYKGEPEYELSAPAPKKTGGRYYLDKNITEITNDWTKMGKEMRVSVRGRKKLHKVLQEIQNKGDAFLAPNDDVSGRILDEQIEQRRKEQEAFEARERMGIYEFAQKLDELEPKLLAQQVVNTAPKRVPPKNEADLKWNVLHDTATGILNDIENGRQVTKTEAKTRLAKARAASAGKKKKTSNRGMQGTLFPDDPSQEELFEAPADYRLDKADVDAYIDMENIPDYRREEAADELTETMDYVEENKNNSYLPGFELEVPAGERGYDSDTSRRRRRRGISRQAEKEATRRAEMLRFEPENEQQLKTELTVGQRISAYIHQLITRQIPNLDIKGKTINDPGDFAALMLPLRSPQFESFKVVVMDTNNKVVASAVSGAQTLDRSRVSPRDIAAVIEEAKAKGVKEKNIRGVIVSHNHPSADPTPSDADEKMTENLNTAIEEMGYELIDHVITNGKSYTSWGDQWIEREWKTPHRAPWEAVPVHELPRVEGPITLKHFAQQMRNGADVGHFIYIGTKHQVVGVERFDRNASLETLQKQLAAGIGAMTPARLFIDGGQTDIPHNTSTLKLAIALDNTARHYNVDVLDVTDTEIRSYRQTGILSLGSNDSNAVSDITANGEYDAREPVGDYKTRRGRKRMDKTLQPSTASSMIKGLLYAGERVGNRRPWINREEWQRRGSMEAAERGVNRMSRELYKAMQELNKKKNDLSSNYKKQLEEYLKGEIAREDITDRNKPAMRNALDIVDRAREEIDSLSAEIADMIGLENPGQLQMSITQNMGRYVVRPYAKFLDPRFKPAQEVVDSAMRFLRDELEGRLEHHEGAVGKVLQRYKTEDRQELLFDYMTSGDDTLIEDQSKTFKKRANRMRKIFRLMHAEMNGALEATRDEDGNVRFYVEPSEMDAIVRGMVSHLTHKDTRLEDAFQRQSSPQWRQIRKSFMKRRDIPREIRELWGEIHDPVALYQVTAMRQRQVLIAHRFQTEALEYNNSLPNGHPDKLFYDSPYNPSGKNTGNFSERIGKKDGSQDEEKGTTGGEAFGLLNGKYTDKNTYDLVMQADENLAASPLGRAYYKIIGIPRFSNVMLNLPTWERNFLTNFLFALSDGEMLHPKAYATGWKQAWDVIRNKPEEFDQHMREGLVSASAHAAELKATMHNAFGDTTMVSPDQFYQKLTNGWQKWRGRLVEWYALLDNVHKLTSYYSKRQRGFSHENAIKRTREAYPYYDMTPLAVTKYLRRAPIAPDFLTFPVETLRVAANNYKNAIQDLRGENSPTGKPDPTALLGTMAGHGLAAVKDVGYIAGALTLGSAALTALFGGDDDDEDEETNTLPVDSAKTSAARRLLPAYRKDNSLVFWEDDQGNLKYMDFGYMQPWTTLSSFSISLTSDRPARIKANDLIESLWREWGGYPMGVETIGRLGLNRDEWGNKIVDYNQIDATSPEDIAGMVTDWGKYVGDKVGPGMFVYAATIAKIAATDTELVNYGGEVETIGENVTRMFTPAKIYTFDPKLAFESRSREVARTVREIKAEVGRKRTAAEQRRGTYKAYDEAVKDANENLQDYVTANMNDIVTAAQYYMTNEEIKQSMRDTGWSKKQTEHYFRIGDLTYLPPED